MNPLRSLFPILLFILLVSEAQAQTEKKENIAVELNEILKDISDRDTPAFEVSRLIDQASDYFSPKAKINVEYLGNRAEDKQYSPRKYFFRISKMPENGIIIKAEDIQGIDKKGRVTGLKILEII